MVPHEAPTAIAPISTGPPSSQQGILKGALVHPALKELLDSPRELQLSGRGHYVQPAQVGAFRSGIHDTPPRMSPTALRKVETLIGLRTSFALPSRSTMAGRSGRESPLMNSTGA